MTHRSDLVLFAVYLVANIALGLWVARRKTGDARSYFLAGDRLPWYDIGGSIIAANISTEHLIGMIGVAYAVGFAGLQLSHGAGHVVRAVLEGLAFELKRHIGFLRDAGLPIERLVLSGSAAASRVTPQILSDVTKLPLACVGNHGGSPLGAAIIARGLCEPAASLVALAQEMAPAASHVEPGTAAPLYQAQFKDYLRSLPLLEANSQ